MAAMISKSRWCWLPLLACLLALVWPSPARTQEPSPAPKSVPAELAPWIDWVRDQQPAPGNCRAHDETIICVWPTHASIVVDETSGAFELSLMASEADVVELIGDDGAWPQDVRVDGKPALVMDADGVPRVHVDAGAHRVQGRFAWRTRPDELRVPQEIAIVELVVGGVDITFPSRTETLLDIPEPSGEIDDEPEDESEPEDQPDDQAEDEPEPDSERIEVSRLLQDDVPLDITTRVDLRISGQARELILPYPVWDDAKLVRIDSELPVSLDDNKQVVIKARAGTYSITFSARLPRSPTELGPPTLAEPWPAEEVWVWATREGDGGPSMGQVAVSGDRPVDRTRTHAPSDWPEGATYSVDAKSPLRFEVLQRGVAESAPNQLRLSRMAVFDLSGDGWTVLDHVTGTMNSSTRLDLKAGQLGSVIVDGQPQVITINGEGQPGVELRNVAVDLTAQWRHVGEPRTLPLAGWSESFDGADVQFRLPRGWDLLHVSGPGRTSTTWLEHWDPLNAILLLGVCIAIGLWVDRKAAVAALIGLVLLFNAQDDGFIPALVLLAGLAGIVFAMQRPRGVWTARSLRAAWLLGMALLLGWVVFVLPDDLEQVWRAGAPALGRLQIERADDLLAGIATLALLGTAVLAGVSVMITKLGGRAPKLVIPAVVVVGVFGLGLIAMMTLGSRGDMAPVPTQAAAEQEEMPPPEEEYKLDEGGQGRRAQAESAGVLGEMQQSNGHFLASPHGGAFAVGNDDDDVWGGLSGTEAGEAYGVGGLGLVGTGRGGGGTGEGTIGLGNTGLIGKGGGGGTGSGYGRGSGAGFGGRGAAIPQVRQAKATVDGPLDRDIVRRIVRAHINEVRSCYNAGLTNNPELGGRVEIQFVIDGDGKVETSVVSETTLPDSSVSACIAKAVKRWQFPKPQGGGSVTVGYPFILENGGGGGSGTDEPESPTRYLSNEELPDAPPPEIPQTGEAMPNWDGRVWTVALERRLASDEQLELVLLSPLTNKLLALLRALALTAAALLLLTAGWTRLFEAAPPKRASSPAAAGVAALLLILLAPGLAWAAPPKELLDELSDRVNQERDLAPSPDCGDECTLIPTLEVTIADDTLTLAAEVHMEGPGVLVLPGPLSVWAPSSVSVDNKPAQAVIAYDNRLLVRMDEGLHRVVARGPVAGGSLNLALFVPPKRVEIEAAGWQVSGLDEYDSATNLEFVRERSDTPDDGDPLTEPETPLTEQARDDSKTAQDLPAWLIVERELEIGPRWSMRTTVRRINSGDAPVKIRVPLLDGEQMIESSRKLEDPKATITLDGPGDAITWTSALDIREHVVLTAPVDGAWTERWTLVCGAAWQCDATGVPPSERSGARSVYHPWPGESLDVALFKPAPAEGARLSIDHAELLVQLGDDGTTAVLSATVRTSTVGERTITIPDGAQLETVRIDGKEIPVNKDNTAIRLTFQPGTHALRIEWRQDEGWSSSYQTPAVSLGGEAVNTVVRVEFTDDTTPVLLRTGGTGDGPRVWFWAWLLAIAGVAVVLHRASRERAAIKLHDWFLLGLGFPTAALPVVLGWFVVVGQRKRLIDATPDQRRYNMVQLAIALLTICTVLLALNAARLLLTEPMSTLAENMHGSDLLRWYGDRTDDAMPQGKVLSVPASLWRVLGVAWVGYVGWRSIAWFKWARGELSNGGWLRWPPPPVIDSEPLEQLEAGEPAGEAAAPSDDADAPRVTQLDRQPED